MKNVVQDLTSAGIDWQREKWQSGLGSKFIHLGEKNAVKYADEVIVLSKGVQDYFKETYGRETHFIPNGVNRPQIREASLITDGVTPNRFLALINHAAYSKEGVSCLLINTERGQHLVEKYGAKIESYPVEFSNIAQVNTQLNRPTKHTRLRNKIFRKYKASGYAGVEAIFERDQRNQKFIWGMYDRICGMFCRKTR